MNEPRIVTYHDYFYDSPIDCIGYEESLKRERDLFLNQFQPHEWFNPITRESIIKKLQQFWRREHYPFYDHS